MKKLLIFGIIATTAFFAASPVLAYSPRQGDLIKLAGNPAVYYMDSSGYRHLFPTEATFFSWNTGSWRNQSIITLSAWEFNQLPMGRNITIRPGYSLIKFDNSQIMYAVRSGGRLCYASANYGDYQYNRASVIPAGFQTDYISDTNCNISQNVNLPDGALLRYKNSNDVYYIQNGQRRHVTINGMTANKFRFESVVINTDWSMSYPEGQTLDGYDSNISDLNAYLVNNYISNYNNNYNYNYGYCTENWSCNSWSNCAYNKSYRTCWDQNSCGTTNSKPLESLACSSACQENWSCADWGACQNIGTNNGWQLRTCTDLNYCGTTNSKPDSSRTCLSICQTNWSCTNWTNCNNGLQTRSCLDVNNCATTVGQPATSQSCY